ncbi:ABC transporter substrate-binding protein [Microbacterium sp. NPDC055910]|uniref:ABC transporter substrate-binding protein n=1 Tax=Microbacterium sp. NPDC055910 TaxID=3345659 RepID=UPI0035DC20DB
MHTARPLAAIALVAVLGLTGCAASSDAPETETPDAAGTTHTVTTDYGDVEVPDDPQRIVVLNYALAGYLYNLDVPVTATIPEDANQSEGTYSEFWADDAEDDGTEFLPWSVDGFDLEAILATDPDLIIGGGIGFPLAQAEEVYDELSDIAPTVLVGRDLGDWRAQFEFLAGVFQRDAEYQEALATYSARASEVAAAITPPEAPSAFLAMTSDGTAYALVESLGLPTEFTEVGIEPAPIFADGGFEVYGGGGDMFELSTEQVGQTITQPTVFVMGFNGDFADLDALRANPVYAALPAFQSDSVHVLPYWVLRGDYDEALALLDIIEERFS